MCRKVLITLGILFLLCTARAKADDAAYAYCPLGEGYVFLYDSVDGYQVLANLKCGEKVTVVDARDRERARVRTAGGKEGYVLKSSITAAAPGSQRQPVAPAAPAAPPSASSQQPQPWSQSQPQPQSQPQTQAKPQAEPPAQAQPQPQAKPSQPETQPQPEAKSRPEEQLQSQPQPQPEPQPEPQPQAKPQPQPQIQLEAKSQPEEQPQPEPEPQPQPQPQLQPQPAATAFTPFSTLGYEQNVPRLEVFGGFSYLNAGTSALTSRQNVAGLEGSVSINANNWLAGEANFGAYYKTLNILGIGTFGFHDFTAMAGPRFNIRKAFFHALVGIDHLAGSTNFYATNTYSSDNALAGAVGGGVQWNISRQFALRTSADYVMSRFEKLTQNNFRVTLGIVFEAGSVNSRGL